MLARQGSIDDNSLSDRIREMNQRLVAEFGARVAPQDVERVTQESLNTYRTAAVLDFVPLLVERTARAKLQAGLASVG